MSGKKEIGYVGKMMDACDVIEVCRVVDMDMVTGAALVYNRTSGRMDIVRHIDRYELSGKMEEDIRNSESMYQMPDSSALVRDGAWKLLI